MEPGEISGVSMIEQYFEGKQKKLVKLDMVEAMKEAKLDELFHVDLWPASTAVRELATQRKTKSFVFSDLKKSVFLLRVCVECLHQLFVYSGSFHPRVTPSSKCRTLRLNLRLSKVTSGKATNSLI